MVPTEAAATPNVHNFETRHLQRQFCQSFEHGKFVPTVSQYLVLAADDEQIEAVVATALQIIHENMVFGFCFRQDQQFGPLLEAVTTILIGSKRDLAISIIAARIFASDASEAFNEYKLCQHEEKKWQQNMLVFDRSHFKNLQFDRSCLCIFRRTKEIVDQWEQEEAERSGNLIVVSFSRLLGLDSHTPLKPHFVIKIEGWMRANEDLLANGLKLSRNVIELIVPFEIENPDILFQNAPDLFVIQTPTRCHIKPERDPKRRGVPSMMNAEINRGNHHKEH